MKRSVISALILTTILFSCDNGLLEKIEWDIAPPEVNQPSIDVYPTTDLYTGEDGTTAIFEVVLTAQPESDVTIPLSSSNTDEGVADSDELIFTEANWSIPQEVTIEGIDDLVVDGDTTYLIEVNPAKSEDTKYAGMDPEDVSVTNIDNDVPPPSYISSTIRVNAVSDNSEKLVVNSDGTEIYAAEQNNNRLRKYSGTGVEIPTENISLGSKAFDILWEPGVGIFVTDGGDTRVFDELDPSEPIKNDIHSYIHTHPTSGIAYDSDLNQVFVLEDGSSVNNIRIYDYSTEVFQNSITLPTYYGANIDMDSHPDRLNQLYICDGSPIGGIDVYDYSGTLVDEWDIPGGNCNYSATATETLPGPVYNDYIYAVSNRSGEDDIVFKLDSSGNIVDQFPVSGDVKGIDVDSSLTVYILNEQGDILKFEEN